jgi:transposase-like protein
VFKGRQFDRSVILLCVRWYLAYSLSLRDLEEMMAKRGISVDHATVGRGVVRYSPELLERFNRRKRPVSRKWHVDETYIKVRGQWMYLYRAIDSDGDTVEFWFSERRNLTAAKQFLSRALKRHGGVGTRWGHRRIFPESYAKSLGASQAAYGVQKQQASSSTSGCTIDGIPLAHLQL